MFLTELSKVEGLYDLGKAKIKIIDFNISKQSYNTLDTTSLSDFSMISSSKNYFEESKGLKSPSFELRSTKVGTPLYRPPEFQNLLGTVYTTAVDMWGLGCVIYSLLTGEDPFESKLG